MMEETSLCDNVKFKDGDDDEDTVYRTTGTEDVSDGYPTNDMSFPLNYRSNGIRTYRSVSNSSDEEDISGNGSADENGLAKPLMHPRHRTKPRTVPKTTCHQCAWSTVYLLLFIGSLAAFACFVVYIVNNYAYELMLGDSRRTQKVVGCSRIEVEDVWVQGIPKLMTESAFRLLDINGDGTLDVLFGFATGAEGYSAPPIVCDIYFSGRHPCLGGLLALDGRTGEEIWRHYTPHEIFSVNCNGDLDGDGLNDCLIAGRVATFEAVSTKEGRLLWTFTSKERVTEMNLYTAQYVPDLNGDGVPEILNIHGGDPFGEPGSSTRLFGKILIFDGKNGKVLRSLKVPDGRESYYSPVVYNKNGQEMVVFGTGGETHGGSLWVITLQDLYESRMEKAIKILTDDHKGYMTPPVLIDLTKDGVEDIVLAAFNSTVIAIDGQSYTPLWNFTYPSSETYVTPGVGYFNDDDVPDFLVIWQYGPGFPVYYHSITTILDGRNGKPLWTPYQRSTVGAQTSPLTVSVEGLGNDVFLYWSADCVDHEAEGGEFHFLNGTNVHEQSRSDMCRLRFKTKGFSKMYGISSHITPPGAQVYYSVERDGVEHHSWVNTSTEAMQFLIDHPEKMSVYDAWNKFEARSKDRKNWEKKHEATTTRKPVPVDLAGDTDYQGNGQADSGDEQLSMKTLMTMIKNLDYDNSEGKSDRGQTGGRDNADMYQGKADYQDENNDMEALRSWLKSRVDNGDTDSQVKQWLERLKPTSSSPGKHRKYPSRGKRISDSHSNVRESKSRLLNQVLNRNKVPLLSKRQKRHVGVHDDEGMQRLISTGTLAPTLLPDTHPDYNSSIEVIFATYWFYPADTTVLLPEDQQCIDQKKANENIRFDPKSKYYGMDDDGYGHAIFHECLEESGHQMPKGGTYVNQGSYNPFNVPMGQLTVYRLRLKCKCESSEVGRGQHCSRVLPFSEQQWGGYMGSEGTSHWHPRTNT